MVSLDAYPSATPEERSTMEQLVEIVDSHRGGDFTTQQCAAISTLCERLVTSNPDLAGFVAELRSVAEKEIMQGNSGMSWRWLAGNL